MYKYPGSKQNRSPELAERLERLGPTSEYREPFLGGASIALAFLERSPQVHTVWLNDLRPELIALWRAVRDYPEEFADRLSQYPRDLPTLQEAFYEYVADVRATTSVPTDKDDLLELAVGTQIVQQMTYNGIPAVTPVNDRRSRWNPKFYSRKANWAAGLFRGRNVRLTATDFAPLITAPGDATIFLDPPYYLEGPKLYTHKMAVADHLRLARLLRECPHRWLLTYDDAPFIRRLYRWATVEPVRVRYFGRPDRRPYRMETELVITPG
jgi:DNA adenine methylase